MFPNEGRHAEEARSPLSATLRYTIASSGLRVLRRAISVSQQCVNTELVSLSGEYKQHGGDTTTVEGVLGVDE